jgi:protoporphyrinogen/coproporphyrinogen III oxidase
MNAPHVLVVGAGFAGLAAARGLQQRGLRVTLLEREAEPGGRARSAPGDGLPFEVGAHVLGGAATLASLARAAGAAELLLPCRGVALARLAGGVRLPLAPFDGEAAPRLRDRLRLARLERVEARFRRLLARPSSEAAGRLDDRSVAELAALYLPPGALAGWVAPLAAAWGLGAPEQASRVALMRLHGAGALRAALPGRGLGALAAALARGLEVRFDCEVTRLEARAGGLRAELADGSGLDGDAAILATPGRAALRLGEPLWTGPEREVLAGGRSAAAVVLRAALERPLLDEPTWVGVARHPLLPLASLLHQPGAAGGPVPEGAGALSVVAAPDWSAARLDASDDALEKDLRALLERAEPGAGRLLLGARVTRHDAAYPLFPVGRYRALARLRRVLRDRRSLGRRLYLAGDYLAGPTVEDAALSGLRAAGEAAEDLAPGR